MKMILISIFAVLLSYSHQALAEAQTLDDQDVVDVESLYKNQPAQPKPEEAPVAAAPVEEKAEEVKEETPVAEAVVEETKEEVAPAAEASAEEETK